MVSFEEAYNIVMNSVFSVGHETIPFTLSTARVLAEDIYSDIDMPPFNRAAVDGYACSKSDLEKELEVMEIIVAGREPSMAVREGQCSKIMTGAIVPEGCDTVVMVEDTIVLPSGRIRYSGNSPKSNISRMGEDVRIGDLVLKKGKRILPQDIAVLASVGHVDVKVAVKPQVAVISTGDEIVEPDEKPLHSKIRNSNAYQLLSQIMLAGANGEYYGIAPDTGDSALGIIEKAISENDIVILTGGVSMGDFDLIPSFLRKAGVDILFDRVNVQPGKPTTFGRHPAALVFGLPGNPVSSFIQFETLVRPVINKMSGGDNNELIYRMPLGEKYQRRSSSRMGWIPVFVRNSEVFPVDYHGSAHITSLSGSDGIISVKPEISLIDKGSVVDFRPFHF